MNDVMTVCWSLFAIMSLAELLVMGVAVIRWMWRQ
jgi:hypothetical protein